MFNAFNLKMALRFLRSKRYGALARFMSIASIAGIAAGVCALIIGLSAMNGFEFELKNRVLSLIPSATITSESGGFSDIKSDIKMLESTKGVIAASGVVSLEGVFSKNQDFAPAALIGIDIEKEIKVIDFERFMSCKANALAQNEDEYPVILGNGILKKLNLKIGDSVELITIDKGSLENPLSSPAKATFKIVGTIKTGGQIDSALAFTNLKSALKISGLKSPDSIHVKVSNMLLVEKTLENSLLNFKEPVKLTSWMQSQGKLYKDINLIRNIMYLAMILVMAVACFNIISNLIMSVSEKSREIAILLTMGMKKQQITAIFTLMGFLQGLRSTVIGVVLGCSLSYLITPFTSNFKNYFGFELLNENIYFINFIPSVLSFTDVLIVTVCSLLMSILAALYPAIKASKISPANELSL